MSMCPGEMVSEMYRPCDAGETIYTPVGMLVSQYVRVCAHEALSIAAMLRVWPSMKVTERCETVHTVCSEPGPGRLCACVTGGVCGPGVCGCYGGPALGGRLTSVACVLTGMSPASQQAELGNRI